MSFAKRKIDQIPSRPRQKQMQVLHFGMSRTGTLSTKVALEKLGLKSYHMIECVANRHKGHLDYWTEAVQAKYDGFGKPFGRTEFDKFLGEWESLSDIPSLFFVDELLEAYPDAKVVVTSRSEDSWMKSMENVVYNILSWRTTAIMRNIDTDLWGPYIPWLERMLHVWTNGDPYNREALRKGFREHYAHVRSIVPADRRFEFDLEDGWEPLCKFLGKDVPNEKFPHANEGNWMPNFHLYYMVPLAFQIMLARYIKGYGPFVVVIVGVSWVWSSNLFDKVPKVFQVVQRKLFR